MPAPRSLDRLGDGEAGRGGVEPFHVVARAPLHEGRGVVGLEFILELRQAGADERNRPFLPAAHMLHDRAELPELFQVGAQEFVEGDDQARAPVAERVAEGKVVVLGDFDGKPSDIPRRRSAEWTPAS